jgi:methionine aminopeptidase
MFGQASQQKNWMKRLKHSFEQRSEPAFKGYGGFPCFHLQFVNHQVVHGIPGSVQLLEGDIISIDTGVQLNGYFADAAKTYPVGRISGQAQQLIEITRQSFYEGIQFAREGTAALGHLSCYPAMCRVSRILCCQELCWTWDWDGDA